MLTLMWGHEYKDLKRAQRRRALQAAAIAVIVLAAPAWLLVTYFSVSAADRQLLSAARSGDIVRLAEALDAGANPDARYRDGRTALHEAAWHGHARAARRLVAAGADVNARDERSGETALHSAARAGRADMVVVLLGAGARTGLRTLDTSAPDLRGNRHPPDVTAREMAEAAGFEDVVRALGGG